MAQFLLYFSKATLGTVIAIVSVIAVSLLISCKDVEEEPPPPEEAAERPMMLFTDTTLLDFYEKEKLSWKLKTAYLERWAGTEKIFARPILVDIYDSLGIRSAFLRADSGTLDMKMDYVYAYGHVYALTPRGASVRADSLLWHKRDNLVKTESYVRVVSETGDVLQGQGFESDAKMDNWHIKSNVTGIFQDAANRLKEEDKKQNELNSEQNSSSSTTPSSSSASPVYKQATPNNRPQATRRPPEPPPQKKGSPAQGKPGAAP